MSLKIKLSSLSQNEINSILMVEDDIEEVALLFGVRDNNLIFIRNVKHVSNIDNSSTSFSISPFELIQEIKSFESMGEELIGFFHTHPLGSQLYPSKKDISFMYNWPYPYIWIIGGIWALEKMRIFTLKENNVVELEYSLE